VAVGGAPSIARPGGVVLPSNARRSGQVDGADEVDEFAEAVVVFRSSKVPPSGCVVTTRAHARRGIGAEVRMEVAAEGVGVFGTEVGPDADGVPGWRLEW